MIEHFHAIDENTKVYYDFKKKEEKEKLDELGEKEAKGIAELATLLLEYQSKIQEIESDYSRSLKWSEELKLFKRYIQKTLNNSST